MLHRQAVDQTAEAYWAGYFGAYGKAFTRKIPRKIAAAIADTVTKSDQSIRIVRARIAPLGFAETVTGGLIFEGVFRGTQPDGATITRLFAAEFDATGNLNKLNQLAA